MKLPQPTLPVGALCLTENYDHEAERNDPAWREICDQSRIYVSHWSQKNPEVGDAPAPFRLPLYEARAPRVLREVLLAHDLDSLTMRIVIAAGPRGSVHNSNHQPRPDSMVALRTAVAHSLSSLSCVVGSIYFASAVQARSWIPAAESPTSASGSLLMLPPPVGARDVWCADLRTEVPLVPTVKLTVFTVDPGHRHADDGPTGTGDLLPLETTISATVVDGSRQFSIQLHAPQGTTVNGTLTPALADEARALDLGEDLLAPQAALSQDGGACSAGGVSHAAPIVLWEQCLKTADAVLSSGRVSSSAGKLPQSSGQQPNNPQGPQQRGSGDDVGGIPVSRPAACLELNAGRRVISLSQIVPIPLFSHAVRARNGTVFLSCMQGFWPGTKTLPRGTIRAEARMVMRNLYAVLYECHLTLDDIVKMVLILNKDLGRLQEANAQVQLCVGSNFSAARTSVAAAQVPAGCSFVIDAIAEAYEEGSAHHVSSSL
jgi:enamine deaminase RidA (YjgF/YER057c/UK114 family)